MQVFICLMKVLKTKLKELNCSYHFTRFNHDEFIIIASNITTNVKALTFPLYSITKTLIASLIFKCVENDRVKLSDTLSFYIPKLKNEWVKNITIKKLLTHYQV